VSGGWDPHAGILAGPVGGRAKATAIYPEVEAVAGLVVVHRASGFTGTVLRMARDGLVEVRGRTGLDKAFAARPGAFAVEGRPVTLIRPRRRPPAAPAITASGSLSVGPAPAKVARASRILVEGVHDAELVERVWGDDLRVEGVVVERLDGVDHLREVVARFAPGPGRRLGILVDHLVQGSKEARVVVAVRDPHVLVTGTPYVDVWEAVKPSVLGIERWPDIPRGTDWKTGVCQALGADHPRELWRRILASVRSYADLQPPLVGAVEQLIDFVTEPAFGG
jgi:hypothetical protein